MIKHLYYLRIVMLALLTTMTGTVLGGIDKRLLGNEHKAKEAQKPIVKDGYITKSQIKDLPNQKMERGDINVSSHQRRAVTDGVYYTMPGGLFAAWAPDGSGYVVSQVVLPPFVETTFKNMKTDKSQNVWTMNGNDLTQLQDENGDIVTTWNPMGMWYTFVLGTKGKTTSYQWNEDNYWVKSGSYTADDVSVISTYSMYSDTKLMLSATDMHGSRLSGKNYNRNTLSGWGFLSTDFLFGTGDTNDPAEPDYTPDYANGFAQEYNALLAPLYIDEIHVMGLTYNDYGPIPEGKSLKAYIMLVDTLDNTTETIATFEALPGDTIDFVESTANWGNPDGLNANKTAYFGTVVFRNTETISDIFGNTYPVPVAVPANKVWRIQFEGVNEEGVCLGVYGVVNSDVEASYIAQGTVLTEQGNSYSYRSHISPAIELLGQFEMIDVIEKGFLNQENEADFPADKFNGWNVLRVSADGQTVSNDGLEGGNYDMGCAFVGTTVPWYDESGNSNYDLSFENAPDWVAEVQVDTTYYSSNNITGYNLVIPVCEPLPKGVTGRQCAIDIVGTADIPGNHKIYILQGDAIFNPSIEEDVIDFADATVKNLCTANWDKNHDGELSKNEAASITSLGTVFKNSQISSFNELQYFTGLTSIGKDAFNASTVSSVTLPKNITALEENAFLDCKSLIDIFLPAKVQTIGLNALSGCTAMESITVDGQNENLCSVDGVLFNKDKKTLIQYPAAKGTAYTVPEGTKTIARDAFYMSNLESIQLPSTLTELAYDAFGYCRKLTDLTIPEGVTTIGEYILDHCTALKTLTIPGTVTSIGQRMANYCTAITDVYSYIQEPFGINTNCFSTTAYNNATLHVPYGTGTAYANATGWKEFGKIVILEDTNPVYAVLSDDRKTLVFYADSKRSDKSGTIYSISDEAEQPGWFGQGSSVTDVVFDPSFANATPKSMYRWFYGMGNLSAFEGLEYLNTAEVTTLKEAFYGCGNLKQVDVSGFDIANATDMSSMFGGCSRLAWLDLSNFSLREGAITSSMLLNCSALKTLKLPGSMSGIAAGACQGVGTSTNPCVLFVPMGFSFGVNPSGIFQWKSGYFRVAEEPVMYADNLDMLSGQTKALTIYLKNGAEEYNSFQFDLTLPDGFSMEINAFGRLTYTLGDRYTGTLIVSSSKLDDHTYRVTAYMNPGDYITGEDGALITLNVKADDLPMGTWTATLTNAFVGMTNNMSVKCEDRAFTLTIGAYYSGDTNHDGLINISDVTNVINYILGKNPSPFYQNEADVNDDGWINISDVTSIISIILGSAHNAVPANSRLSTLDYMYVGKTGNGYDFYLENHEPYSACEMTVQLPEGCVLGSVMLDERHSMGHKVMSRALGDGVYRLAVYSTDNAPFIDDESPLLHLTTYGRFGDDIGISGILFVDGQNTCVSLPDVSGITTGISKIGVDTDAIPSYNIQGIPVDSKTRGVHVEKNRKFMVK